MKNFFNIGKLLLVGLVLVNVNQGCTDLEEELFSEIAVDDFFQSDEEVTAALGAAYTSLYGFMGDLYAMQQITSDENAVPTRGNDWDDGGNWRRLHLHTYNPLDPFMNGTWSFCYGGINTVNRLLFQFEQLGVAEAAPELRALRAYYYFLLIDMYGNVPLVTDFADTEAPATSSRQEVFNFIESELTTVLPDLSRTVGGEQYGRMNFYAAQTVLANLYMNAEIYTGSARWEDAEAALDVIIDSGSYTLMGNFFDNFSTDNAGSTEIIFAIPYDQVFARGFNLNARTLHYGSQQTYDFTFQPWNGYCALEEFYNSFDDEDIRKGSFIQGQQFTLGGEEVIDAGAEDGDFNGPPLFFQAEINELGPNALRQAGTRIGKYEFEVGATENLSNDFILFRYADVLLMKAETIMRQDGDMGEAMDLVNQIRNRARVDDLDELDMDILLAERGRELAFEGKRRTDLIRFGRYNDEWWAKRMNPNPDEFSEAGRFAPEVRLFPIPAAQIDANQRLEQNPGY